VWYSTEPIGQEEKYTGRWSRLLVTVSSYVRRVDIEDDASHEEWLRRAPSFCGFIDLITLLCLGIVFCFLMLHKDSPSTMMKNLMGIELLLRTGSSPLGLVKASKHWLLAWRFIRVSSTGDVVIDIVSATLKVYERRLSARCVDSLPEITSPIMIRSRHDNHQTMKSWLRVMLYQYDKFNHTEYRLPVVNVHFQCFLEENSIS
jgi:hypothetical protein